jgi:CheY-like chemotaxis protein
VDYSLLIVEDNSEDLSRLVLAFAQAARHIRLCVTRSADEAKSYLCGADNYADRDLYPIPQLVLLGLELRRDRSFEFLEWLAAQPAFTQIPVIVLASPAQAEAIDTAYALGANSCLLKTMDDAALRDVAEGIGDYAALLKNRYSEEFTGHGATARHAAGGEFVR